MGDDITNAIDSLNADAETGTAGLPITSAGPAGDTADLPPIIRPEDLGTETQTIMPPVNAAEDDEASAETDTVVDFSPVEPVQQDPEASGQTFAPMPQLASEQPTDFMLREPVAMAPVNPAMVPDPLYTTEVTAEPEPIREPKRIAVDGSPLGKVPEQSAEPKKLKSSGSKKVLFTILYSLFSILLLVGGYFGVRAYSQSNRANILAGAITDFASAKGVTSQVLLTSNGEEIKATYDIDLNGNKRAFITEGQNNMVAIKPTNKDSVYLGESTKTTASKIRNFTEYTGIEGLISTLLGDQGKIPSADDISKLLTATSGKYVTFLSDGNVDGKAQYQYKIVLDEEALKSLTGVSDETSSGAGLLPSGANIEITLMVDKVMNRLTKISINSRSDQPDTDSTTENVESTVAQAVQSGFNFTLDMTVGYSFTDAIKLPIGSKISSSVDIAKIYEDSFGATSTNTNAE